MPRLVTIPGAQWSTPVAAFCVLLCLLAFPSSILGHGVVGKRMFIEPIFTEDANIKNELDLPRMEFLTMPDGSVRAFGVSLEKTLYPGRWSVTLEQSRVYRRTGSAIVAGFDNLEIGTKLAVYRNEAHEFILTPVLSVTVATASRKLGERHTSLHPSLLFAKGLGDVRWSWLRPFAVQGGFGYERSVSGERDRQLTNDIVLMYSVPYLNHFIRHANRGFDLDENLRLGHSWGAIGGNMFPFVEFNSATPVAGTHGHAMTFLRPGSLYMGKYFQVGAAMDVPLRGGAPGTHVGAVLLLDLYLDEIDHVFAWTPFGRRGGHDKR